MTAVNTARAAFKINPQALALVSLVVKRGR